MTVTEKYAARIIEGLGLMPYGSFGPPERGNWTELEASKHERIRTRDQWLVAMLEELIQETR